ncbi:uncharacterized protein LOC136759181 [Amia ocellicauda]|uniref:uncharacterized protein LOC136759181 n=1 Tax=Amia ocellicauda TaxID=2972642 RepID=UPI0034642A0D
MDLPKDLDSHPAETDVGTRTEEDSEWNAPVSLTPDRNVAEALLEMSEEDSRKDGEPYELHPPTWDEAICGWGRSSPFDCLFQVHKKGKKSKQVDAEYHCLLCIDSVQFSLPSCVNQSPDSPKIDSSLVEDNLGESLPAPVILQNRPASHPGVTSAQNKQSYAIKDHDKYYLQSQYRRDKKPVLFSDKPSEDAKLLVETPHRLNYLQLRAEHWPPTKDSIRDKAPAINSFAVLPPVTSGNQRNPRHPFSAKRSEVLLISRIVPNEDSLDKPEAEPSGIEKDQDSAPKTQKDIDNVQEDVSLTSVPPEPAIWHWQSHFLHRDHFPMPFKKSYSSLTAIGNVPSRVTNNSGRNFKQDDVSKNGLSQKVYIGLKPKHMIPRADPELPILLGTRVPIPASAQRLL